MTEPHPYTTTAKSAQTYPSGELVPKTHGTTMGTKMAVAFTNIFMAKVGTKILNQSRLTGRSSGNDSSTTSSPSGTQPGERSHSSLNKLTNTIKLSRLQTSWTLLFTKTRDLKLSRC